MSSKNILLFGASSSIATAIARCYASANANFYLLARNQQKLANTINNIESAGGSVRGQFCYDFNQAQSHQQAIELASACLGEIDLIVLAHGSLPDQQNCEADLEAVQETLSINCSSTILIMTAAATLLEKQGRGTLAVISSVAGDRGRKSNYFYGACKSAVNTVLEGMHGRFLKTDVNIVNIKPGMIDTPMTAHLQKGILWASPEQIAPSIVKAIEKGKAVIYAPGYWRIIMWLIRLLPRSIMGRLSI